MWRSLLTLYVLFSLTSTAIALTWIYDPIATAVTDNGAVYIGSVGKNHLVRLILNAEYPDRILSIRTDYPASVLISHGRAYVEFNAPSEPGPHTIRITLEKNSGIESFTVSFDVVEKPLKIVVEENVLVADELRSTEASVVIVNPLASSTYVTLTTDATPKPLRVFLPRHEVIGPLSLEVKAGFSGTRNITLTVEDELSGESYENRLTLVVRPTVEGRVKSILIGPDLFFPILYPIRLVLGVLFWR